MRYEPQPGFTGWQPSPTEQWKAYIEAFMWWLRNDPEQARLIVDANERAIKFRSTVRVIQADPELDRMIHFEEKLEREAPAKELFTKEFGW